MIFNDEFDGNALNRSKWCTRLPYGNVGPEAEPSPGLQVPDDACLGPNGYEGIADWLPQNGEWQRYRDFNTKGEALHVVSDGVLHLIATKTRTDALFPDAEYESAMIRSKRTAKPAKGQSLYMVAQIRLPDVQGTFPAGWLLSGWGNNKTISWPPELDIFEAPYNNEGQLADVIHMAALNLGGKQTNSGQSEYNYSNPNFDREYGNYFAPSSVRGRWLVISAEWNESGICYAVDGVTTACEKYRWVYDDGTAANPALLLFNLAIGGDWATRNLDSIDASKFPLSMDIDYVRIYRSK